MWLLLLLITAIAYTSHCYAEGGFYVGIGAGYSTITNIPQSGLNFVNGSSGNKDAGTFTSGLYGGYNFNRIVGIQLDYNIAFNGQLPGYRVDQQLFDAAVLLHLPFEIITSHLKGFSLYAKGGVGYSDYEFNNQLTSCINCINMPNSANAMVPVYGAGAEYSLTNIGIRAEWDYSGNVTASNLGNNQIQLNSNMYLLSILYYF